MGIVEYYNYLVEDNIDPRTKDWFLVHNPVPVALILFSYVIIVFVLMPKYMKNREAYSLRTFMKFYNVFQIISNAALVYGCATAGWTRSYSLGCEPLNLSTTGEGYRMAVVVWWVYMIKVLDLIETVLYTLRKKYRQISVLHIYHHITTMIISWICTKWIPGGMLSSIVLINCAVHVIMYSYYFASTGGPVLQSIARFIKPWITIIQMTQFCILVLHISQGLLPFCDVPKFICALIIFDLCMNLFLFYNFYRENYRREKIL